MMTYFEAENASRHNPNGYVMAQDRFIITTAGTVKYVYAPVPEKSYLAFSLSAPSAGQYNLWFRVLAPSAAVSEFYVSIDGGPEQVFKAASGTWSSQWQWSKQSTLTLTRGTHAIVVRSKHINVGLDKFLLTNGLSYVPAK
jgi:hypothetical protein